MSTNYEILILEGPEVAFHDRTSVKFNPMSSSGLTESSVASEIRIINGIGKVFELGAILTIATFIHPKLEFELLANLD